MTHIGYEGNMDKQRGRDCGEKTRGGWEMVVVNGSVGEAHSHR